MRFTGCELLLLACLSLLPTMSLLGAGEVEQNVRAGAESAAPPALAEEQPAMHFETKIAGLLARNCLECHDSFAKEGGLDLSRRVAALAGGESGQVIVPGNSAES